MSTKLRDAIILAAELHDGQTDKAGEPYILHPLRVMLAVKDHGEAHMISAVLHDVIEDCGFPLMYIAQRFSQSVQDIIDALTRRENETYPAFIRRCKKNPIAAVVKLADIRDNRSPERMARLPLNTAKRLQAKYTKAKLILEAK